MKEIIPTDRDTNAGADLPVFVVPASFLLAAVTGIWFILKGRIFLDAGFYLHAARAVTRGLVPYRDFFFVQGPVYPYVYGWLLAPLGHTVPAARILSFIFALITLDLTRRLAVHWGGVSGGRLAVLLLALSPIHMYFFIAVKLYALTGFLLMSVFVLLTAPGLPRGLSAGSAAALVVVAAATRLTLVPAVPIVLIHILLESRRTTGRVAWERIVPGVVMAALLSVPFLAAAGDAVIYYLLKIHTSAETGPYVFHFGKQLRVLARLTLIYLPVTAVTVFILWRGARNRRIWTGDGTAMTALLTVLAVTAVHLKANWFSPGYESILMPLAAALAAGVAAPLIPSLSGKRSWLSAVVAILLFIPGCLSVRRYTWPGPKTVPAYLAETAEILRRVTPETGEIAGCNAVFALSARRPVAHPFGGAPFTFTPRWSDAQCRRYNGLNTTEFLGNLQRKTYAALIVQNDSFAMGSPGFFTVPADEQARIFQAIHRNYRVWATIPNMGNGERDLAIYIPRDMTDVI